MKLFKIIAGLALLLLFAGGALAQIFTIPQITSTSVTSATTPVLVCPAGPFTTYSIHTRSGAAVSALCFPYLGTTVPTVAPSGCATPNGVAGQGCQEVNAGTTFADAVTCDSANCGGSIGRPWACVLASGVTAITVDCSQRGQQ